MKVTYIGPSTEGVDVIHADPEAPDTNTVTHCAQGEPVDLPNEVAREHLATGCFDPSDKAAETALRRLQKDEPPVAIDLTVDATKEGSD